VLLHPVFGLSVPERLGPALRFNCKHSSWTDYDMIHVERGIAADVVKDTKPMAEELVQLLSDCGLGLVSQRQPTDLADEVKSAVRKENYQPCGQYLRQQLSDARAYRPLACDPAEGR
jgi:hypothetical protein